MLFSCVEIPEVGSCESFRKPVRSDHFKGASVAGEVGEEILHCQKCVRGSSILCGIY